MPKEADDRPDINVFATTVGQGETNTGELKVRAPKAKDLSSVAHDANKRAEQMAALPRTGRRPKITSIGVTKRSFRMMGPEGRAHFEQATRYHRARCQTLYTNFGHVSESVALLVSNSATQNAIARWYINRGIEDGDDHLVDRGIKYQNAARQMELSAWEMCAREAKAFREVRDRQESIPWVDGTPDTAITPPKPLPEQLVKWREKKAKEKAEAEAEATKKAKAEAAELAKAEVRNVDESGNAAGPDSWLAGDMVGPEKLGNG